MAGRTRFVMLGGYLGAGKTTLAVNLAGVLRDRHGKGTAMITNDQGDVLVDTEYAKTAGFDVRGIAGGCFCSSFDDLVSNARTLVSSGRPDVMIAEPIGTSTNIMNSVVAPLRSMYPDEFSVAPLMVVMDCVRAMSFLSDSKERTDGASWPIPSDQIREAEIIILSNTDMVSEDMVSDIKERLKDIVPDAEIVATSSTDPRSLDRIVGIILSDVTSRKTPMPGDSRRSAFEKAKLGWYSGEFSIKPSGRTDMYSMITDMMRLISEEYGEAAVHVKVVISSEEAAAKMSLVGRDINVDSVRGSRFISSPGMLTVNARIVSPPKKLEKVMLRAVGIISSEYGMETETVSSTCFSPRPESPSHFFFE